METFSKGPTERERKKTHSRPQHASNWASGRPQRLFIRLLTKWRPHPEMNPLIGSPRPASQRLCRASRPCPTRLRRTRRAGQKARSHYCWEGEAESAGSWKARETLFLAGRSWAGGRGGAPLWAPPSFLCQSFGSVQPLQLGPQVCICQKEFPFLYLPLCVSSCLRSLFGISHFFAGFRFQSPLVGPRGLGPSPILGRRRRPRATPARAGPPRTTLPSGLSGRRRGCGQVTESPDLR